MRNEFDGYKLICSCKNDVVNNEDGQTIAFVMRDRKKEIFLCKPYFKPKKGLNRAAVILHEVSHKCGTIDWAYFTVNGEPVSKPIEKVSVKIPASTNNQKMEFDNLTAENADNYLYWALKGFCLPDYDCEPTMSKKFKDSFYKMFNWK
jgi:hypothetical protein